MYWLFDPVVFVDDDGTYLIYFSSVVPNGQNANPKIARIAKLSGDITGTVGIPSTIMDFRRFRYS